METTTPLTLEHTVPNRSIDVYDPKKDAIVKENMHDYHGKFLILFFYPADFTFVCPTELKDLQKSYEDIIGSNAEVLVVSVDTVFSHKRRVETEGLLKEFGIKMVSDRTGNISKEFGILNPTSGNSERATYIISPEGVIKSVEIVTEPIGRSSAELVRKLRALEFVRANPGQACPASWNSTMKTIKPSIQIAGHVDEHLA